MAYRHFLKPFVPLSLLAAVVCGSLAAAPTSGSNCERVLARALETLEREGEFAVYGKPFPRSLTPMERAHLDAWGKEAGDPWAQASSEGSAPSEVANQMKSNPNLTLPEVLNNLRIPAEYAEFYEPHTGKFHYPTPAHAPLAVESGSARLKAVRINADGNLANFSLLLRDYSHILAHDSGAELWIIVSPQNKASVETRIANLPKAIRARVKISETQNRLTPWAQDGSKPLTDGRTSLTQKRGVKVEQGYPRIMDALERAGLTKLKKSNLAFEGGNIIVGEHQILVGSDIVEYTMWEFRISRREAVEALSKEFGRPVLELGYEGASGNVLQAHYHIDLSVALVKDRSNPARPREVALLHSPFELFEKAFGIEGMGSIDGPTFKRELKTALEKIQTQIKKGERPPLTKNEQSLVESISQVRYDQVIDEELKIMALRRILLANGYEVRKIPGQIWLHHDVQQLSNFNYTNVILSGKTALVPHYDIPMLDRLGQQTYRDLGYEVMPMRSTPAYMCLWGGPRCASETYRRPEFKR